MTLYIVQHSQFLQFVLTVTSAGSHKCEFAFLMMHQKWLHLRPAHMKLHFLCPQQNIILSLLLTNQDFLTKWHKLPHEIVCTMIIVANVVVAMMIAIVDIMTVVRAVTRK